MRKLLATTLFTFIASAFCFSQTTFEVPKNYELKVKEDYAKYEPDIIKACNWLEETDLDKETAKRKEVGKFFMTWLMGSPTVSIELNEKVAALFENNSPLMTIYFTGGTRHALQNKGASNFDIIKACVESVAKVYKKGIGVEKNKALKKLLAAYDKNALDEYVAKELKVARQ